jgi:hypothetical protein
VIVGGGELTAVALSTSPSVELSVDASADVSTKVSVHAFGWPTVGRGRADEQHRDAFRFDAHEVLDRGAGKEIGTAWNIKRGCGKCSVEAD